MENALCQGPEAISIGLNKRLMPVNEKGFIHSKPSQVKTITGKLFDSARLQICQTGGTQATGRPTFPLAIQRLFHGQSYLRLRLRSLGYTEIEIENADLESNRSIFKLYSYVYIKAEQYE